METNRQSLPRSLARFMFVGMWIGLLALLSWHFSGVLETQRNPNQQLTQRIDQDGVAEVVLQRNRRGHYVASGAINGRPVTFLVDTGATDVSIPAGVAEQLGLSRGRSHFATTANGTITVYATRLPSISLGGIELHNVRASINPHMDGDQVLLGMSFLRDLELVQRGDKLTLRQFPN